MTPINLAIPVPDIELAIEIKAFQNSATQQFAH